jgi:hypothetical protein
MIKGSRTVLIALLTLVAFTTAATAQTVSSTVEANLAGVITTDAQGPTNATDVQSFLSPAGVGNLDFTRDGFGRAAQNRNGVGAVSVEAVFANADPTNSIVSNTLWTDSATNNSAVPVVYEFSYLIAPPELRLADFAGANAAMVGAPNASFDLEIRSNGVVVFSATASLVGGFNGHSLTETGTSLNPQLTPNPLPPLTNIFGYDFDSAVGTINLGTFNPGQTVTVEYEMTASVVSAGFELGGRAAVGDPFDLSGTPGFTGTFLAAGVVAVEESSFGKVKAQY